VIHVSIRQEFLCSICYASNDDIGRRVMGNLEVDNNIETRSLQEMKHQGVSIPS